MLLKMKFNSFKLKALLTKNKKFNLKLLWSNLEKIYQIYNRKKIQDKK